MKQYWDVFMAGLDGGRGRPAVAGGELPELTTLCAPGSKNLSDYSGARPGGLTAAGVKPSGLIHTGAHLLRCLPQLAQGAQRERIVALGQAHALFVVTSGQ